MIVEFRPGGELRIRGDHQRFCPHCQEAIHKEASKCRHCYSSVMPESLREAIYNYGTSTTLKDIYKNFPLYKQNK
jgi:predicted amidophosphoribosyltransferase